MGAAKLYSCRDQYMYALFSAASAEEHNTEDLVAGDAQLMKIDCSQTAQLGQNPMTSVHFWLMCH